MASAVALPLVKPGDKIWLDSMNDNSLFKYNGSDTLDIVDVRQMGL